MPLGSVLICSCLLFLIGIIVTCGIDTHNFLRQRIPVFVFIHSGNPRNPKHDKRKFEVASFSEGISVFYGAPHCKASRRVSPFDALNSIVRDSGRQGMGNKFDGSRGHEANTRSGGSSGKGNAKSSGIGVSMI